MNLKTCSDLMTGLWLLVSFVLHFGLKSPRSVAMANEHDFFLHMKSTKLLYDGNSQCLQELSNSETMHI